ADPNHSGAYGNLGDVLAKMGQYERAAEMFTKQLAIREHPYYYIARGLVYGNLGQTEKEKADYLKTLELDPSYAYAYNNLGVTYHAEGNLPEAIKYLEQAIQTDADILSAHRTLGNALAESGREEEALAVWDKALEHFAPGNNAAVADLTRDKLLFFKWRGRYQEAAGLVETLRSAGGLDAETMCHVAECVYELERFDEAKAWYTRALKASKKKDPYILVSAAGFYEHGKINLVMADAYYIKALQIEPDNYEDYIRLARVRLRRRLKAEPCWRKAEMLLDAVPLPERTPCYHYWRAECLRGMGRPEAEEAYCQAVAEAKDYQVCATRACYDAFFGLACLYAERGDTEKARKYLENTLAIKNDVEYRNFLRLLDGGGAAEKEDGRGFWGRLLRKIFS
ncbi:MAG: tetratricopeptide repeat protein, partial [Gracilibacteraceae bacterium]|nr:tetratricopeptide repeat protein [Gracilibacteraceae bacterium]